VIYRCCSLELKAAVQGGVVLEEGAIADGAEEGRRLGGVEGSGGVHRPLDVLPPDDGAAHQAAGEGGVGGKVIQEGMLGLGCVGHGRGSGGPFGVGRSADAKGMRQGSAGSASTG
jgi:hypothetical protein